MSAIRSVSEFRYDEKTDLLSVSGELRWLSGSSDGLVLSVSITAIMHRHSSQVSIPAFYTSCLIQMHRQDERGQVLTAASIVLPTNCSAVPTMELICPLSLEGSLGLVVIVVVVKGLVWESWSARLWV